MPGTPKKAGRGGTSWVGLDVEFLCRKFFFFLNLKKNKNMRVVGIFGLKYD